MKLAIKILMTLLLNVMAVLTLEKLWQLTRTD